MGQCIECGPFPFLNGAKHVPLHLMELLSLREQGSGAMFDLSFFIILLQIPFDAVFLAGRSRRLYWYGRPDFNQSPGGDIPPQELPGLRAERRRARLGACGSAQGGMGSFRKPRPRFLSSPVLSDLPRFHAARQAALLGSNKAWNR